MTERILPSAKRRRTAIAVGVAALLHEQIKLAYVAGYRSAAARLSAALDGHGPETSAPVSWG